MELQLILINSQLPRVLLKHLSGSEQGLMQHPLVFFGISLTHGNAVADVSIGLMSLLSQWPIFLFVVVVIVDVPVELFVQSDVCTCVCVS